MTTRPNIPASVHSESACVAVRRYAAMLDAVCFRCGRDMRTVSGGIGNVTCDQDGNKLWCGCTERNKL